MRVLAAFSAGMIPPKQHTPIMPASVSNMSNGGTIAKMLGKKCVTEMLV